MTPTETARAWLADPLGVMLDFETTALDGFAVEIAVTDMAGEPLLYKRLWPGDDVRMDSGAEAVHGITLDSLRGHETFDGIRKGVNQALGGRNVVAYNCAFDRGIYEREARRLGLPSTVLTWRCAMLLYGEWLGVKRWQRLEGGDHTALGDCRAALAVLRRIAEAPYRR